jgi:micrococcal nuclease
VVGDTVFLDKFNRIERDVGMKTNRTIQAFVIVFLFLCVMSTCAADKSYGNAVITFVGTVYDGKVFSASIADWPPIAGDHIQVRILGIATPSLKDKRPAVKAKAIQAKEYVAKRLKEGKKIELVDMRRDKFFRILAVVLVDGKDLGAELVKLGLASEYTEGAKEVW